MSGRLLAPTRQGLNLPLTARISAMGDVPGRHGCERSDRAVALDGMRDMGGRGGTRSVRIIDSVANAPVALRRMDDLAGRLVATKDGVLHDRPRAAGKRSPSNGNGITRRISLSVTAAA